jgi:competence CoiA-like predicted nuclease
MEYALEKNQNHEIDDTKRIHAADALYKKDGGEYYCEVCHQRLYKSTSSKGNPYFYHDGSAEMYCTKETWTLEETTSWHKRIQCAIKSLIPNIQLEKYLRRNDEVHRADAYLASDSQNMVIEVQSSHIDIEDVQKRNAFYTINGKCLWILNTAKHFASGEISVTWSAQQQPVIETTSTLIHNVVYGRNTANVSICLQKNENAFVFIQAAYKNYCIDGLYGYRVSQTYTWDELVEMITQDSLPQYSLSFEEQNFISIPRKIK